MQDNQVGKESTCMFSFTRYFLPFYSFIFILHFEGYFFYWLNKTIILVIILMLQQHHLLSSIHSLYLLPTSLWQFSPVRDVRQVGPAGCSRPRLPPPARGKEVVTVLPGSAGDRLGV